MSIAPVRVLIIVGASNVLPAESTKAKLPSSVTLPCWMLLNIAAACTANGLLLLVLAPATSRNVELFPLLSDADNNGSGLAAVGIGDGEFSVAAGGDIVAPGINASGCSAGACGATIVGIRLPVRRAV